MKKYKLQMAVVAVAVGLATQSKAALYDISFAETDGAGSVLASGWIDVTGGVADGGVLAVSGGANTGLYNLVTGVDLNTSDTFTYDNLVSPGSDPFLNNVNIAGGLLWANGDTEINMWYNTPAEAAVLAGSPGYADVANAYGLWGNVGGPSGTYDPQAYGTASLTSVAVPESSWTTNAGGLAALGVVGFALGRRKISMAA